MVMSILSPEDHGPHNPQEKGSWLQEESHRIRKGAEDPDIVLIKELL